MSDDNKDSDTEVDEQEVPSNPFGHDEKDIDHDEKEATKDE